MDYLLDTHTLIWYFKEDAQLSKKALDCIQNPDSENYISVVSLWEMAVKISLNKLNISRPFREYINDIISSGISILPIQNEDNVLVSSLPFHHRDPFDRMLIAQAINGKMSIISKDDTFSMYNDLKVIW